MKQLKAIIACLLMLAVSVTAFAQSKITGNVTDSNGEPIIGASVMVKGTSNGTITDLDGGFTLNADKGTLVVSYIGYKTQEVAVSGKTAFKITMKDDAALLDEIVVVGYGTQKKASLTSAITQVGEDVFKDRGIANAGLALQGEVPGLVVTRTSSRPGSENMKFKIRGNVSINDLNDKGEDTSSPLVIIDGITSSLDEFSQMDPNNIQSVSVLKDASAAIYGSRSAYGVVLVTTKKGSGKAKITYNGNISTTIDGIKNPITNQSEWMQMFKDAQTNDAAAIGSASIDWWIFNGKGGETFVNRLIKGESFEYKNGNITEYWSPTDLQDFMYGNATSQKHTLTISGADEKFSYLASVGYADSQSQLKIADDGEKKWNGRINADYQATKMVKIETGMSYDRRKVVTPRSGVGGGWNDMYFWPVYNPAGQFYDTFGYRNPVAYIVGGGDINTMLETFRANMTVNFDLSKWVNGLSVKASGAFKKVDKRVETFKQAVTMYDWVGTVTSTKDGPGEYKEEIMGWENQNYGVYANYARTFNEVHNVAAMLGINAEQENYKKVTAGRNGGFVFPGSDLKDLDTTIGGSGKEYSSGGANSWGLVSYMTRLNYDYKGKYLIEALGRRDGSSRLYPEYRWKNFYSASAGWRISEEEFMKSLSFFDNLKVRYNYGKTGSVVGIGEYESYQLIKTGSLIFGSTPANQTTAWVDGMSSSDRTWETILSHNIGLDFTILDNRLSGTFDWFTKTNDGMFISNSYPSVLGASAPKTNDGKFRTHGWEVALDWRDKAGQVNYNIGFVLGDTRSKVIKSGTVTVPSAGVVRVIDGKPLNAIYAFKTDGIIQTQAEADAYYAKYYYEADGTTMKPGNIIPANNPSNANRIRPGARKLVDVDGDGVITKDDVIYMGDNTPHYSFGIKMGLNWKGFDFNAFFQGVGSQNILRSGNLYAPFVTNYTNQNKKFIGKTWTEDNPNSEYTMLSRNQDFNKWNYQNRDISVDNSKYIRLKSLIVGYTIPKQITQKAGIGKLRLYFSGEDLFEFTSIKDGFDPEQGENSNNTFPFSRLLSFGIDLTF